MTNLNAKDIERLCDNWIAASSQGGVLVSGIETEKFRLMANGVQFHELDHETLCVALLSLSKVLLRPGLNTVVHHDHFAAWSWCGQLLVSGYSMIFPIEEREIQALYEASIHAALVGCRKPSMTPEEWSELCRIDALQPHHSKQLLQHSSLVLAYLTFPLLEAVLKRACAAYVAFDGQVVSAFSVPGKQSAPKPKLYGPPGEPGNHKCSSLRDLLFLHSAVVASPNQKALLDRFRDHLTTLDAAQDPFDLIYSWRNQSLHGSTNFQTIGGTMLSLALLISLFEIEQSFEERRLKTLDICRWEADSPCKTPWSFYPPY
ncbi:MAG: hypothetical protein ACRC07_13845 [Pseudomonas paracarnis]